MDKRKRPWYAPGAVEELARGRVGAARLAALAGALAAAVPTLLMWGFTVDDALVSVRYATNLAAGLGYRFCAGMPPTDGVTPLPWAPILAAIAAGASPWTLLVRAKILGALGYVASSAVVAREGSRVAHTRVERVALYVALVVLALAFPVGAWAASGMETGVATALASLAAVRFARPRQAALLAGLAASFRPEMLPWALVVASGAAIASLPAGDPTARARRVASSAILSAIPFVACASVRLFAFGHAAPLALSAKPSDLAHGLTYAGAATVVALLPLVVAAPLAILRASPRARTLALAFVAHVAAVVLAGGDWMPYARLLVPVVPSLVIVAVEGASRANRVAASLRVVAAAALGVLLLLRAAPNGRTVMRDRAELVERARPVLAGARVVAALDVGWVSASTDARIVDLAGLTDPAIATLPGGHTSKRVDVAMLLDRDVDTVLVYGEPRVVERRIVDAPLFGERFSELARVPFGARGASYVVYRRALNRADGGRRPE